MSREIPYEEDIICDQCGKQGGYDFMGDYLCPECIEKLMPKDENYEEE